jgi:hypothetical protein
MQGIVATYSPAEAVQVAFRSIDSSINAGIEPNKAIRVVARRYDLDPLKLEELYVNRDRDGGEVI